MRSISEKIKIPKWAVRLKDKLVNFFKGWRIKAGLPVFILLLIYSFIKFLCISSLSFFIILYHLNVGDKREPKVKNVALKYTRVSTKRQKEAGLSIPSQLRNCNRIILRLALKDPFNPIKEIISGRTFPREGVERVLELAAQGKFSHLVMVRIDRWGRNFIPALMTALQLLQYGIVIVTENRVYSKDDKVSIIVLAIDLWMADMEATYLGERTQSGIDEGMRQGYWTLSYVPFGYRKKGIKVANKTKYMLEKDEEFSEVIEFLFDEMIKLKNYSEVAKLANERFSDLIESGKTKKFTRDRVRRIVTNPVYIGRPRKKDEEYSQGWLQFIEEKKFYRVQEIAEELEKKAEKKIKETPATKRIVKEKGLGILTSLSDVRIYIACRECGSLMVHNGRRLRKGWAVERFYCRACNENRDFPSGPFMEELEKRKLMICPHCGSPDDFEFIEEASIKRMRVYLYRCKLCGKKFPHVVKLEKVLGKVEVAEAVEGRTEKENRKEIEKRKKRKKNKKRKGNEKSINITALIHEIVTKYGPVTSREVYEKLLERGVEVPYPTVRGTLSKKYKKGIFRRDNGRYYLVSSSLPL